jgi:ABC-type transport system substrate-binding protein
MTARGSRALTGRSAALRRTRVAAVGAAALVLCGCTPPGLPPPIAPAESSAAGSIPAADAAVTIGVDGTVTGFNPHAIADYSPAELAIGGLVLPSVSTVAANGSVVLNRDLVDKAAVTSTDPFTVTYTLDRNASWSDGTPITAEDFSYLRDQMLIQPGTVDPAGYRLISSIVSRDAGKSVDVSFVHPVANWVGLFSPLLPSHLLKDSPGGWTQGLAAGIPVSGNRYKMQSNDVVTGEITLVRNDKFWGSQPRAATAVIRIGTAAALTQALRRGDLQAVLLQPDAADQRTLDTVVPVDRRLPVSLPGTIQLVLNTAGGATAQQDVRRAVAAGLDLAQLRSVLTGRNADGGTPVPSLVSLSSAGSSQIVTGDRHLALADLAAAGYHRESLYMSKNGQILRLTLTYPSDNPRLASAAQSIQSQLQAVGIEVLLLRDSPRAVVDNRLALGTVDMGLVMVPRGPFDALAAGSAFDCPLPAAQTTGTTAAARLPRAGNLSGYCSAEVQPMLDLASVSGTVRPAVDDALSAAVPVLPILRPSATFAASALIAPQLGLAGPGWAFSGPLTGLSGWPTK